MFYEENEEDCLEGAEANESIWILVDTRGVSRGSPAGTRRSSIVTPKREIQKPTTTVFRVASQKVKQVVFGRSTVRLKVR